MHPIRNPLEITTPTRNTYCLVKLEELTEHLVEGKIDTWLNEAISSLQNEKVLNPSIFSCVNNFELCVNKTARREIQLTNLHPSCCNMILPKHVCIVN